MVVMLDAIVETLLADIRQGYYENLQDRSWIIRLWTGSKERLPVSPSLSVAATSAFASMSSLHASSQPVNIRATTGISLVWSFNLHCVHKKRRQSYWKNKKVGAFFVDTV